MSLSKYYKSSDSFQPEKIVNRDNPDQQKWSRTRFEPGPDTPSAGSPVGSESEADRVGHEASDGDMDASNEMITDSPPSGETKGTAIDPGNFIEIVVAEAEIEEAFQRGLQEGLKTAETDFGDSQRAMLSACQQLDSIRETLIKNSRDEVLEFAMAIAERIVRISVREQDRTIIATIDEALQKAVKSDEFTIYIHPRDYEIVSQKTEDLVASLSGLNNIVVKEDNTIEQGGVKIESDNCTIDGSIATQFDVIRKELGKNL